MSIIILSKAPSNLKSFSYVSFRVVDTTICKGAAMFTSGKVLHINTLTVVAGTMFSLTNKSQWSFLFLLMSTRAHLFTFYIIIIIVIFFILLFHIANAPFSIKYNNMQQPHHRRHYYSHDHFYCLNANIKFHTWIVVSVCAYLLHCYFQCSMACLWVSFFWSRK